MIICNCTCDISQFRHVLEYEAVYRTTPATLGLLKINKPSTTLFAEQPLDFSGSSENMKNIYVYTSYFYKSLCEACSSKSSFTVYKKNCIPYKLVLYVHFYYFLYIFIFFGFM